MVGGGSDDSDFLRELVGRLSQRLVLACDLKKRRAKPNRLPHLLCNLEAFITLGDA